MKKKFIHLNDFDDIQVPTRKVVGGNRVYVTPGGNIYPSITSLLSLQEKPGIEEWRKRVGEAEANRISKESTALGTKVHSLCEDYLYNDTLKCNDVEAFSIFNRLRFLLGNINNIYCLEAPLYSDMLSVAGTVDCVAEYNGKLSVIDFKTSKKTKKEEWIDDYFIQAFFYAAAFFEMTGAIPEQIIILIAIRDSFEVQVFKKPLQDMEIYIDKLITIMKKNPTVIQQT